MRVEGPVQHLCFIKVSAEAVCVCVCVYNEASKSFIIKTSLTVFGPLWPNVMKPLPAQL